MATITRDQMGEMACPRCGAENIPFMDGKLFEHLNPNTEPRCYCPNRNPNMDADKKDYWPDDYTA